MKDLEFFGKVLGITRPFFVSDVRMDTEQKRVDLYVEHEPGIRLACPECNEYSPVYDHAPEKEFQHLPVCQMQCFVHIRLPRVKCDKHGVRQIANDLGEADMTYEFAGLVIDLAKECSIEAVSRLTGVSWHRCWAVVERCVELGFSRKEQALPRCLGVDEKSFAKGHKYETLVYDIDKGTVEYVADFRKQESLEEYYKQFSKEEKSEVEAIAMDMWDPYIAATKAHIPEAEKKIVFDRYHVTKVMTEAVDKVRKAENRELVEQKIDVLKGTKYLWLWNKENVPAWRVGEFAELRSLDLKVSRAWALKENLRNLWHYKRQKWALNFFKRWYHWATHSKLKPVIEAAKTLKRHLANIVTYLRYRITNALGESLNANIEKVKRIACGFRNREHYKTAIYFHCGGLDLYPRPTRQVIRAALC